MQKEVLKERKITYIQRKLKEGVSREEVAESLGYKNWKCLDIYMRRCGLRWNSRKHAYSYPQELEYTQTELDLPDSPSKIATILLMFSRKNADPREIAKKTGFENNRQLAFYMASKGYKWSMEQWNYVKSDKKINIRRPDMQPGRAGIPARTGAPARTARGSGTSMSAGAYSGKEAFTHPDAKNLRHTEMEKYTFLLDYLMENKNRLKSILDSRATEAGSMGDGAEEAGITTSGATEAGATEAGAAGAGTTGAGAAGAGTTEAGATGAGTTEAGATGAGATGAGATEAAIPQAQAHAQAMAPHASVSPKAHAPISPEVPTPAPPSPAPGNADITRSVQFTLSGSLLEYVDQLCLQENVTHTQVLRKALLEFLKKHFPDTNTSGI